MFSAAGAHLRQLIDDLLDLSRVEAGRLEVAHAPFAPRAMGEELAQCERALARKACARVLRHRLRRVGDAQRVRQIVNPGQALKSPARTWA
ncbi:MAG: hypothetical protein U5L05_15780 [Rubrivivax sp.]|nr:hypothetical protein [Rubrivivax sp.]